ncbi:MAG: hypothetical protein HUJ54_07630, partial [Erysipelotrichaceae bacterium]|nr:hypothetical protein [Erysipelotrichaceae bacterium]MCF0258897.1 hypothetical protein [Erysipelotrichaceae bacterium]MCF0259640.1 hypothetical protein [Erysipelotrichaceae bacterium]MCF0259713.1 hypothetical protein [Erysipelotrichaceae bacterium]
MVFMNRRVFLTFLSLGLFLILIGLFTSSCLKEQAFQFVLETGTLPTFDGLTLALVWRRLMNSPLFWVASLFCAVTQIIRVLEWSHSSKENKKTQSPSPSLDWCRQERQYQSTIKEQTRRIEQAENLFHQIKAALGAASLEADLLEIESELDFSPLQNQLERCRQISYSFLDIYNNPAGKD